MKYLKEKIKIEVCVDSIQSAIAAQRGGADRIELCDNLSSGGTTPSLASIELTRKYLDIDINVLIRPRSGDFCYSHYEFEILKRDIDIAKEMGANGIVTGILTPNGDIDIKRMEEVMEVSESLSVTFHRAFDMTRDPYEALKSLIALRVNRILTSGQSKSAIEGIDLIQKLINNARDSLIILPGGGINPGNLHRILSVSGIKEVHLSGKKKVNSAMIYRNDKVSMGGNIDTSEFENYFTDECIIREVRNIVDEVLL